MAGIEDSPGAALDDRFCWPWESFPEYLGALAHLVHALGGTQVAKGALRGHMPGGLRGRLVRWDGASA